MTDLLERLRAENPVPDCPPPRLEDVWRKLDATESPSGVRSAPAALAPRRRPARNRLRRSLIVALGVIPVVVVIVLAARTVPPSIAARVLTATDSSHSVVHYVADVTERSGQLPARRVRRTRWEVWLAGNRAHVLIYQADRSGRWFLRAEIVVDGDHIELYRPPAGGDTITTGVLPRGAPTCTPALTICGFRAVDPVAVLRRLAIGGSLHQAGETVLSGRKATVLENQGTAGLLMPGSSWTLALRALVNTRTFIPIRITTVIGPKGKPAITTTSTITGYQRLPTNIHSEALLGMPPHKQAHVQCGVFEPDGSIGYPCPAR
jgi:hypothetical protein